jgi:putative ATPase
MGDITKSPTPSPLAERMRPKDLDEFFGQTHLLGPKGILRALIASDVIPSMIFWGEPGTGKTTLARIIAGRTRAELIQMSAISTGVPEVRKVIERAATDRNLGRKTILFIDEIHRWSKAQQDALLHAVEDGTVALIGATTENPSFEVISPLLSRCRVFRFQPLGAEQIGEILDRAMETDGWLKESGARLEREAREALVKYSGGDARTALNGLEIAVEIGVAERDTPPSFPPQTGGERSESERGGGVQEDGSPYPSSKSDSIARTGTEPRPPEERLSLTGTEPRPPDNPLLVTTALIERALMVKAGRYDKKGDYHYDTISAFIKSLRGSDPDAAVYYLARMLEAGEDPLFIARRMIALASEDIGNANPNALLLAVACFQAVQFIGLPEARLNLSQTAIYLASSPKSNASYVAISEAIAEVQSDPDKPVPLHLRNAVTGLMKRLDYGKGYAYDHESEGGFAGQNHLPEGLEDRIFYRPSDRGAEKQIKERLEVWWRKKVR